MKENPDIERRSLRGFAPLFGLFFFAAALWVLYRKLGEYHYQNVLHDLGRRNAKMEGIKKFKPGEEVAVEINEQNNARRRRWG
ncbi:MAG: hypothetical protein WAO55_07260 [Candidatus Manganitrophaceae bacterium]